MPPGPRQVLTRVAAAAAVLSIGGLAARDIIWRAWVPHREQLLGAICGQCHAAPAWRPTSPTIAGRFCECCIRVCFDHPGHPAGECAVCTDPGCSSWRPPLCCG